jgi:hypothetical protein
MLEQQQQDEYVANMRCVVSHLSYLQDVVTRMEMNSNSCKTICAVLIASIMISIPCSPEYALIGFIPVFLFFMLDSYYLANGRSVIRQYEKFVKQVQDNIVDLSQIYNIKVISKDEDLCEPLLDAATSISIAPVYTAFFGIVFLMYILS